MLSRLARRLGALSMRSLRMQLLLWIALPVATILFALSLTELRSHEQAMERLVQQRADNWTHAAASLLAMRLDSQRDLLVRMATEPGLHDGTLSWSTVFAEHRPFFPAGLAVWSSSGTLVSRTAAAVWAEDGSVRQALFDLWDAPSQAGVTWWPHDHDPVRIIGIRVQVEAGKPWIVAGAIPVSTLSLGRLPALLSLDEPSVLRIRDERGRLLFVQEQGGWQEGMEKQVSSRVAVPGVGWTVELQTAWADLVPPLLRFENLVFVVVIAALIISLTSAYFGLRNIAYPLQRLNQIANRIGWGDFDAAATPAGGVQEIEDLRLAMAHMARQIHQYQQELQSYIGAMTMAQEEERRRLARELHDGTVQALIALNQQFELIERRLSTDPEEARLRLQELRPLIAETIADLRRQIHDLRPLYLEDLGFVPALEMLVHQLCERHQLVGELEVQGQVRRLDPALEIGAYRIVQEALHNVAAHARATWVHVELAFDPRGITLRIEDNGQGFQVPESPSRLAQQGHFGLLGIQERAQLHGGWLRIHSTPGQGTTLVVRLEDPQGPAARSPA